MAHQCPIRAGDVAALEGIAPDVSEFVLIGLPGNALDAALVALVERLVEQLCRLIPLTSKPHASTVQGMVRRSAHIVLSGPDQDLAQFSRRQAGADDRAMKCRGKIGRASCRERV